MLIMMAAAAVAAASAAVDGARATPAEQARAMVAKMTFEQQVDGFMHGVRGPYVGQTGGVAAFNVPPLTMEDGPQGVADGVKHATVYPGVLTVTSAWDDEAAHRYGEAMATEQRMKGTMVMLGPMVNIARVPTGGRNFESTGEEPYLAAPMARALVQGIQSRGVIANVKHLILNNQEFNRTLVSASVDERTWHEVYMVAFKAAAQAGCLSAMCSYNRINGTYACEHESTLRELKAANFDGFIVSDWGATHSAVPAVTAGLDIEMPEMHFFNTTGLSGAPRQRVADAAARVLTAMIAQNLLDNPPKGNLTTNSRSPARTHLARTLAVDGTVLLHNDGNLLPLAADGGGKHLAVIGEASNNTAGAAGHGSGYVCCENLYLPLAGITDAARQTYTITAATNTTNIDSAVAALKQADVAVVVIAVMSGEGHDRTTLGLDPHTDELLGRLTDAGGAKIVLVVYSTGGVDISPHHAKVGAVVAAGAGGEQFGGALADVLFGRANPAGRLPVTWASRMPFDSKRQYPGEDNEQVYSERLEVGYKWYRAHAPSSILYPFGHGVSYTTFSHVDVELVNNINERFLKFFCVNDGNVMGDDVPQLYVKYPEAYGEPGFQLRAFKRVRNVRPGEKKHVKLDFSDPQMISFWNVNTSRWQLATGTFTVALGASATQMLWTQPMVIMP